MKWLNEIQEIIYKRFIKKLVSRVKTKINLFEIFIFIYLGIFERAV